MRREPAHERSGVRAGAHWPVDNARDGDPAAGNHPGVVAAANPAAAGRSSGRLFGVRTGSGAGIDEPHRPSPAWLGRVVPTGGDRVAVLVDVGPFDSPIVFMMSMAIHFSPLVVRRSPRWWPRFVPADGRGISPALLVRQGPHPLPGGGLGESVGLAVGDAGVGVVQETVDGRGGQRLGHDLVEPGRVQVRRHGE